MKLSPKDIEFQFLLADGAEGNALPPPEENYELDEQAAADSILRSTNEEFRLKDEYEELLKKCSTVPSFASGFEVCSTHGVALTTRQEWNYNDLIFDTVTFCPICEWVNVDPLTRKAWLETYKIRKDKYGYGF